MLWVIFQQIIRTACCSFVFICFISFALLAQADISLSGNQPLPSNAAGEYAITQDLGITAGHNLFHSFHHFSLAQGETATFSGAAHIDNVISRVTGGDVSRIHGTIKNTIPGAETYLLNPAGILFGEGARLDVQGGFHAATAESLHFSDGGEFYADAARSSHFSTAAPSAFGGLAGDIGVQNNAHLQVTQGQALELQANNIHLEAGARLHSFTHGDAAGAELRLIATQDLLIEGHNDAESNVDSLISRTDGSGAAGDIVLQGQTITVNNASINANTEASGRGANIEIKASGSAAFDDTFVYLNSSSFAPDAGQSGDMRVQAENISLTSNSIFNAGVMGGSNGSHIRLQASADIVLDNYSHLYADTFLGTGNGGTVFMQGHNISLNNGAFIDTTTKNIGDAGNIDIRASGTLFLGGDDIGDDSPAKGRSSTLASGTFPLVENRDLIGQGGSIDIQAQDLVMRDGALIYNGSLSLLPGGKSGDAGRVTINVADAIHISGVNPYGEIDKGFASGIYLNSIGEGAGRGGELLVSAGSVTLEQGAMVISNTDSAALGGTINMTVRDTLRITGDAQDIPLREPASTQARYLARFTGDKLNQATSGIYSNTEAQSLSTEAGDQAAGGSIHLHADNIELDDNAMISSASSGVGAAGELTIRANRLQLSAGASIRSSSSLQNRFTFADSAERDGQFLLVGDVLEVADVGNGQRAYYVQTAHQVQRIAYLDNASFPSATGEREANYLATLAEQESLASGDIVTVNGQAYMYKFDRSRAVPWIAFEYHQPTVILPDMNALTAANGWFNVDGGEHPSYPSGTQIQVINAGDGKPAEFIYAHQADPNIVGYTFGDALRIKHFNVTERGELNQLSQQFSLIDGTTAHLSNPQGTTEGRFFYQNHQWLELNPPRPVADLTNALNDLQAARLGYVSRLPSGDFISVGTQWLPVTNNHRVANLSERDALPASAGDLVSVADAGQGEPEQYYYHDNAWQSRIHGGDAGRVTLNIEQDIRLEGDSRITTEAVSSGGGSIDIRSGGVLHARDSHITTSVQEGAGNGGDLRITSDFLVQHHAPVIARAVAGNGGNIQIQSKGIFQFGGETVNPIDASSQFGVSGAVELVTPDDSVSGSVFIVNGQFIRAEQLSLNQCETLRNIEEVSRFVQDLHYTGVAKSPESFQE